LSDKLERLDRALSHISTVRLAVAIALETADHMPVLETSEISELKEIVSDLVKQADLENLALLMERLLQ